MRLLFIHERFGAWGGAEANVLATSAELKLRDHTLALVHGPPTGREEAAWSDTFPQRWLLPSDSADAQPLRRALAEFRPDVVFLHKLSHLPALEMLAAAGVPVVRMVHDHDLYCLRGYKYNPLNRRICTRSLSSYCVFPCGGTLARNTGGTWPVRWVSMGDKQRELALNRRFARLVVATVYMRDELVRNGVEPRRIAIHAPVPPSATAGFQCSFGERNRIVYAGQIIRGKGVDVLLESLAQVRTSFECIVLGDGNHRAHCERLAARLGLRDRVRFEGFVPQAQVPDYYREATLAVMSSLWPEPFGAVGLEAMRCGLPVVAFNAGGIREWLIDGWNGFLVPWMNRARYATAVEMLLRDKALARRMGEHGRQWVGERFGFFEYIASLERLFGEVAGAANPVRASA